MTSKIDCGETLLLDIVRARTQFVADAFAADKSQPAAANGYFVMRSVKDGRVLLASEIGNNPEATFEGRYFNAHEKGKRLFSNSGHCSSWQSRDLEGEPKKYGGAIAAPDYIFSFSGLPELADEALMIIVAIEAGWMTKEHGINVLMLSDNKLGQELVNQLP